ncbi:MAG: cupredoxin domain-containing protein [Acidimicrobiia bacterium]
MKRTIGLLAVIALLAGACGGDDDRGDAAGSSSTTEAAAQEGPLTFTVLVDGPSPEGKNIQLSAYFPGILKVHAGDTVVFDNKSTHAPHTISFGINSDRSNSPPPVTKAAAFNPAVFGPCVTSADPTAELDACPEAPAAELPPYTGKGYWNSGILVPAVAPAGAKQVSVKFDESTPPGSYNYACILHGLMGGSITVVGADDARDVPEATATSGAKGAADAAAAAAAIPDPADPGAGKVVSGWGNSLVAVNRFLPAVAEIKAGETVTWQGTSEYEPHTITFEAPFTNPEDPRAVPPTGAKTGGSYTGGFTNSGLIGPAPFPADTFSLRFPKAGEYAYVCVLHPGMAGSVKVTGAGAM